MVQVGVVTVGGMVVGTVTQGEAADNFAPNLKGYEPAGRASSPPLGGEPPAPGQHAPSSKHHGGDHREPKAHPREHHQEPGQEHRFRGTPEQEHQRAAPKGEAYSSSGTNKPFHHGSEETDQAIRNAAKAHDLDVNTMRSIASIESSMDPSSNANRRTQYKGLYQVGTEEWQRFGQGNVYSAHDNAMATARMFSANREKFQQHFGRAPTDTELYLMHQQGLGFYTKGAMTNIQGNPYPGMRGPQTHESFEAGWGSEVARRKAGFVKATTPATVAKPAAAMPAVPEDL